MRTEESSIRPSTLLRLLAFLLLLVTGFFLFASVDFDFKRLVDLVRATDPLVFLSLMSLLPLIGFPIAAFYLYAGSAFPWWQAWLLCSLSLAVNISLAYPIARHLLREPLSHILSRYQKRLPTLTAMNQFRVAFLVRSVPGIPFFLQNYLLPLLDIRFGPYFLISWSIQTVFAAGMAAVPHLVDRAGWVPAIIVLFILVLLGIFRRFYLPAKA